MTLQTPSLPLLHTTSIQFLCLQSPTPILNSSLPLSPPNAALHHTILNTTPPPMPPLNPTPPTPPPQDYDHLQNAVQSLTNLYAKLHDDLQLIKPLISSIQTLHKEVQCISPLASCINVLQDDVNTLKAESQDLNPVSF